MSSEKSNGAGAWRAPAFTRLRGNMKGAFDDAIGPKTLFVGPNQSGKSGRVIGIRYALGGVAAWSLGVHGSEIAELAPYDSDLLFSELEGPAGRARFQVLREEGKWREPEKKPVFDRELQAHLTDRDKERILPLVSMSDLLALGPDLGRRALMLRFGDAATVPEPIALKPEQQKLWDSTKAEQTKTLTKKRDGQESVPDASEVLVAMKKAFNKRKLEEGGKMRGLEKTLDERRGLLVTQAAGSEMLPGLRAQLEKAEAWESVAHLRARQAQIADDVAKYNEASAPFNAASSPEALAKVAADDASQRKPIADAIAAAQANIDALEADLRAQRDKLAWGSGLLTTIERAAAEAAKGGPCACPLCKNSFDPKSVLDMIKPAVDARRHSIGLTEQKLGEARGAFAAAQTALQTFERQRQANLQTDQQARNRLAQEHARILAAREEVNRALAGTNAPSSYDGPPSEVLRKQIKDLEDADTARKSLERDTAELRRLKDQQTAAKDLEGEADKLLDALNARTKHVAEAAVNKYMPEGLQTLIDLSENTWRVLDKSGAARNRHTMCGFETDALVPALAAAYTEPAAARFLTLDDPDVSGVGLENAVRFFGALGRAVDEGWLTQVFVAGNRFEPVLDQLRAIGWTIIMTDAPAAAVAPNATPSIPPPPAPPIAPAFGQLFNADGSPRL